MKRLSIIVPVYNEEDTIDQLLNRVCDSKAGGLEREIIVVNDGSTDQTRQKLDQWSTRPNIKVIHLPQNRGKGYAVRRGILESTGEIVVIQDADLEYDPDDWELMLKPFKLGYADAVYGSRFIGRGPRRSLYIWHDLGNRFLTLISNLLSGYNISDMETCYKMIRGDLARRIGKELKSDDFSIEPELTARLARHQARLYEVGVAYYGRTYAEGKKINWVSGVKALWAIIRYNLIG